MANHRQVTTRCQPLNARPLAVSLLLCFILISFIKLYKDLVGNFPILTNFKLVLSIILKI